MSAGNRASDKIDELAGKTKKTVGRATGNRDLAAEGRGQQVASDLQQAGGKVTDAFK